MPQVPRSQAQATKPTIINLPMRPIKRTEMERLKGWIATFLAFLPLSLSPLVSASGHHDNTDQLIDQLRSLAQNSQHGTDIATLYDQLDSEWKSLTLQIREALQQQQRELSAKLPPLKKPFLFDPWHSSIQSPPDFPKIDEIMFPSEHQLQNVPAPFIRESIPPIYRLAEYLGIGKNYFNAEAFFSAPHLFFGEFNGYEVKARVRQHIFGTFQINETGSAIETFRRSLETQGFYNAINVRISSEVKPHHFSLREIPLSETYILNSYSEWNTVRMPNRFARHSVSIGLSGAKLEEQEKTTKQVKQHLENRLTEYRKTIAKNVESKILQSKSFREFSTHLIAIHKFELALHKNDGAAPNCQWNLKPSSPTDSLREQIALIGEHQSRGQSETLLPQRIRLSAIHAFRHATPPSMNQHAAEIAWSARLSISELEHD